ncbi:hypothetical protein ACFW9O_17645 [Streptomyces sp. NPDC059499]|uniref:hypothetical protein n=1 Tax=Streptomyces sp. NPDC059499 TaxID=3346852 RepID=UPI0036A74E7F
MNTNPFPPAAVDALAAGLDNYRLATPTAEQTPADAALTAAEYLVALGWAIHIPEDPA